MGKNKSKKNIIIIVLIIVFCVGVLYCGSNYDEISMKLDDLTLGSSMEEDEDYTEDEDYCDEEMPEDCGYDDVGGTPEEQEEYATQDRLYTIDELNEKIRGHLLSNMNLGADARLSVYYDVDEYGEPNVVTIKLYLTQVKVTSDNKELLQSAIAEEVGENINVLHDQLLNTYINYGYDLDSLDFQITDTFGIILMQSKGYLMDYSDEYYDFG